MLQVMGLSNRPATVENNRAVSTLSDVYYLLSKTRILKL